MSKWGGSHMPIRMQSGKRKKKKPSRLGNALVFFLVFALFLAVFGGVFIWMLIQNRQGPSSSIPGSEADPALVFDESDARTVLLILAEDKEAWGFVLARSDPASCAVVTAGFPPDTLVGYGSEDMRLTELYRRQTPDAVKEALQPLWGYPIDHYAVASYSRLESIYDYFEKGLDFTLPQDVTVDRLGSPFTHPQGRQTLITRQIIEILRFDGWQNGPRERAAIQAQILCDTINQYMKEERADKDDFGFLINQLQPSDIQKSHHLTAKAGLDWLKINNAGHPICASVEVPGTYRGSGETRRFEPDDDAAAQLARAIRSAAESLSTARQ